MSQIWSFSSLCYQKKNQAHHKNSQWNPKAHQLNAGPVYVQDSSVCSHSKESSSDESFCLQLQIQRNQVEGKKIPNPVYLITNLAHSLKLHHSRNMYLWARLDTCADVNVMLASVYHLIFKDPEMKKITPYNIQIITFMQDHSCTPFKSTQIKIRLSSPMGQLNHKYNGSSKENKTSIFESS